MRRPAQFNVTAFEREAVKAEMRDSMIAAARERRTMTYTELAESLHTVYLHPHSYLFAHLMREVCREEEAKGHGMLCALVVSKQTGMPGGGYFRLAALRGLDPSDLDAMWRQDLESLFSIWSSR